MYILFVAVNPVIITSPPKSVKAELYHQVTLTCEATGDLPITYQWQRDGQVLLGETSFSLVISEVAPEDRGAYTCTATNHVNNVTSEPAIVSIRGNFVKSEHICFTMHYAYYWDFLLILIYRSASVRG